MRRLLLIFFVFIILGVVLSLVFRDHQGYLLVSFNGWQIETSLLFAAGALLVFLWAVITLWRLVVAGVLLPRNTRWWFARRRAKKARRSLHDGLLRLSEGRWSKAEKELNRLAEDNDAPGLHYLHAARAAQHQGHVADRDRYLKLASGREGVSELAVLLTRAQLETEQGQSAEALSTLSKLYEMEPTHPEVLRLYAGQALSVGDFEQLRSLLPALYKHANIPDERVDALAIEAWHDELKRHTGDANALTTAWRRVPKRLRATSEMTRRYVDCLRAAGAEDQAADVIRDVLKREWDASLVLIFGDLKSEDRSAQLATVERWIKQYGEEPELLLVAGRLCLRNRLWGRARSYFEASQKNQSRPEALLELGRLFEEINEKEEARAAYRQGLELKPQP